MTRFRPFFHFSFFIFHFSFFIFHFSFFFEKFHAPFLSPLASDDEEASDRSRLKLAEGLVHTKRQNTQNNTHFNPPRRRIDATSRETW